MRIANGTTDVPTAGTRVQLRNTNDRVLWISVKARQASIYFGDSAVSSTAGYTLGAAAEIALDFRIGEAPGSVLASTFWVDATVNGNDADWIMILA